MLPDSLHTFVSTNYLLRTSDEPPAYITVQTTGWRKGPREVLERLFDPTQASDVDPGEYSFRLNIKLETGDERYSEIVNGAMWIGSGARMASEGLLCLRNSLNHSTDCNSHLRRLSRAITIRAS